MVDDRAADTALPELTVSLEIDPAFSPVVAPDGRGHAIVHKALTREIVELLAVLGAPGRPIVAVSVSETLPSGEISRLTIDGEVCRYSEAALRAAAADALGPARDAAEEGREEQEEGAFLEWLRRRVRMSGGSALEIEPLTAL